ncbi:retrovirus-related pol polyprotein from transposon TNT 1-94 [Tanacetum coccineum]
MACDVSWKAKLSTLHDKNVLLKHQAQHHNEINEMIENVNQKTYDYVDVRAQNQDLLMTISELKSVGSSNSVRRPKSKDNKSKNSVLKNTKISSTYVWKTTNSVCLDSNKCETKPSNVYQTNACITNSKTVTVVNDRLNTLCISCGLDVFLHSHDKCVARHALTRKSSVKRALFTSPVAEKSKGLGATSVVAKSRFNVAKTPIATNKVIQLVMWIVDSGCLKHMTGNHQLLRNFVEKFMGTIHFGNDHFATIIGRNRTLVEAARTILIFSRAPEFLWAEAIATTCFTQNLSIVHTRHNKTSYELIHGRKPNVQYFHVFGSLCNPTNDRDDLGKMKPKADIGIFVGYSESSRGFRIYNRQTKKIMETIHVKFDELTAMAFECNNLEP